MTRSVSCSFYFPSQFSVDFRSWQDVEFKYGRKRIQCFASLCFIVVTRISARMSIVGAENLADIYPNRGMKLHFYEQQAEHTHAYKCSGNMGPARE